MDTTVKLKNRLIDRIKNSQDTEFLQALEKLLETSENSLYKISREQEESVAVGRSQITNGEYFSNETVMEEAREWLKRK